MTPRTTLLSPIQTFLQALTTPPTSPTYISTLLSAFTIQPTPLIHEHGLPQLAPFLGRSFTGTDGIARYFELLAEYLSISDMSFENEEAWLVDDDCMAVVLRGRARFTWKGKTADGVTGGGGQGWDETFIYRIALAEETGADVGEAVDMARTGVSTTPTTTPEGKPGKKAVAGRGQLKVCEYRVWADTGAAYLARMGRLGDLLGEKGGVEGIYFRDGDGEGDPEMEERKMEGREMEGRETRGSLNRKRSGSQDVLGAGLSVYGSCG